MNPTPCSHFLGLWHPDTLPTAARATLHALGPTVLLDAAPLCVLGLGSDPWPGAQSLGDTGQWQLVVGEPVFVEADQPQPRTALLARLAEPAGADPLPHCQGSFCGLRWRAATGLELFADALGLRPLYWMRWHGGLIFSTHLGRMRQLLGQLGVALTLDEQGTAESLAFAYSLGDRSCWQGLHRMRHGMRLHAAAGSGEISQQAYRRLEAQVDPSLDLEAATARLDAVLERALRDRLALLPPGARSHAFLSGGMDSRLVVAKLMACAPGSAAQRPVTLNVAPSGSQDAELGNRVAAVIGTEHHHRPTPDSLLAGMQASVAELARQDPVGARLWWSGDGGSVGLGHVYLREATGHEAPTELRALATLLAEDNRWRFSGASLDAATRAAWLPRPVQGVVAELTALQAEGWPLEKLAFGFLLLNDQQRHLDGHFESLDEQPYDLVLPFFDARLLQQILRTPTAHLLRHRLYNHWFATRLGEAGRHAWQSYPGHEPCPHPMPEGLRAQWTGWHDEAALRRLQRSQCMETLALLLRESAPPGVQRTRVAVAALLTGLGWRDMRYALTEAAKLYALRRIPSYKGT